MSVLIRGMKMPECCDVCTFSDWSNLHQTVCCKLTGYEPCFDDFSHEYDKRRSDDCLLVELPEKHGDLIDRDALPFEYVQEVGLEGQMHCVVRSLPIKEAQAVIEAEGD